MRKNRKSFTGISGKIELKANIIKNEQIKEVVAGKRVIMVDDSIVRGTTSKQIVQMLRDAGTAEVHMVVASTPTRFTCYYGIDTSRREELIASK